MINLQIHSDFSLQLSSASVKNIIKRIEELQVPGCALTDYGSISGAIQFISNMQEKGLKPIIGCKFFVKDEDQISNFTVLARNKDGWKELINLVSESNLLENIDYNWKPFRPVLPWNKFDDINPNNFIAYTGYLNSNLSKALFTDYKRAVLAKESELSSLVNPDLDKIFEKLFFKYKENFDELYIATQTVIENKLPIVKLTNKIYRDLAQKYKFKIINIGDPHYTSKDKSSDHRVILSSREGVPLKDIDKTFHTDDCFIHRFFLSNDYFIPSAQDFDCPIDEIKNAYEIADKCEIFKVNNPPSIPKFECENISQEDYLKELCRKGWREKIQGKVPQEEMQRYIDEIKNELSVILPIPVLSSYFLIVQDYCNWARNQGMKIGERGSGAGCLISYLIGITNLDPVHYELFFERFYNSGRNSKDRVSLPDIDVDFPKYRREEIIDYIKNKYGQERFASMVTFHKLQGKGALKEVLRAHSRCSNEMQNLITKNIPQDADISDHLKTMKDQRGESSAIIWALENFPEDFSEWCTIEEKDDELVFDGSFGQDFAQAIRIEGCKKSQSKHASGYILSTTDLSQLCPLIHDTKSGKRAAGFEMDDLEKIGLVKVDILVSLSLDKLMYSEDLINGKSNAEISR